MPASNRLQARRRRAKDGGRENRGDATGQPSEERPSGERTARGRSSNRRGGNADHHASTCRWAIPTLFLPAPYWWDAEDRPWACVRDGAPRALETTEVCTDCPYWEPRTRGPLTGPVSMVQAFREALEDTYRARATCRKVIEAFGPVQPFVKTMQAEERYARALSSLFDRMAVQPPRDTWPARVSAPDTLVEACAAAGRAEMERQAMYERLIPFVRDPAARRIMRRIQSQSQRRHLPAFRRCFTRALKPTGRPRGVRRGRSAP
jgi:hypothetical protein